MSEPAVRDFKTEDRPGDLPPAEPDEGLENGLGGSPRPLFKAGLRFALLLVLLAGSFAVVRWTPLGEYFAVERLQALLAGLRGAWWSPIALVGLCVAFGAVGVPATPFIVAGAAIFGWLWGTLWNWLAVVTASAVGYLLAHFLGREFIERIGGDKVRRAERILHRRGFLPLIAIRFVPIPFALVNASAAVVGVRFTKFLFASALGLLPPISIMTYFSAALLAAATGDRQAIARQLAAVLVGAGLLVFSPLAVRRLLRRRRLLSLRSERSRRPARD